MFMIKVGIYRRNPMVDRWLATHIKRGEATYSD